MRWWRQLRSLLLRTVVVLLLAPTAIVALYRVLDPPLTPLMVIRLFEGEGLARSWRSLDEISPHLARAVIAAEDNLFCRHHGFDTAALQRALQDYIDGERAPGASTITMQTAKNILLWPGRDPVRKLIEAWLTPQIELFWPKRRILEVYLNVVEMGPGIYGAEAAARAYFGKAAVALGPQESALIAAVLPNPRIWSPKHPTRYIAGRARTIAGRVGQLGPLLDCA